MNPGLRPRNLSKEQNPDKRVTRAQTRQGAELVPFVEWDVRRPRRKEGLLNTWGPHPEIPEDDPPGQPEENLLGDLELENLLEEAVPEGVDLDTFGFDLLFPLEEEDPEIAVWQVDNNLAEVVDEGAIMADQNQDQVQAQDQAQDQAQGPAQNQGQAPAGPLLPIRPSDFLPSRFFGDKTQNARAHFMQYEDYLNLQNIQDPILRVQRFVATLAGPARIWFQDQHFDQFDDLRTKFL